MLGHCCNLVSYKMCARLGFGWLRPGLYDTVLSGSILWFRLADPGQTNDRCAQNYNDINRKTGILKYIC